MKKSVFNNRMNQLFNNEVAQTIRINGNGDGEVRSTPLAIGDELVMRISDTTTIDEIVDAREFSGNNFTMVHFEDGKDIALSKLCRRANGLRLKGATLWEMLRDFIGRVVANGGMYKIRIVDIREQVFTNGNVSKYYVFEVITNNVPVLENDEIATDNATEDATEDA